MFPKHFIESLLGLPRGYLSQQGDWSLQFNPAWPGQGFIGAGFWNALLAIVAVLLVIYVYSKDGKSRPLRVFLGLIRACLLALVIFLLNRPVLTLGQTNTEPSVLAVMIDDSGSMKVPDAGPAADPQSRLAAVQNLLSGSNGDLIRSLSKKHNLRFYKFDRDAAPLAGVLPPAKGSKSTVDVAPAVTAIGKLAAEGNSTQVLPSILSVMQDLQGQRVAGVVVMTDGRDTPAHNPADGIEQLKAYGVKVYPVAVGADAQPKNIEIQNIEVEDTAFKGDVLNVKAMVRATGYEPNHPVHLVLKDKKTGTILPDPDGKPSEKTVNMPDDKPVAVELQWKTSEIGDKDLVIEAVRQPGELDYDDNSRTAMVSVLDEKVTVLFVDGYPRWEYRYLKTEMIRDKSMTISCLLASADANFLQEGNKPLPASSKTSAGHFPDTLEQLMEYDVIIVGDVDPRYFSDTQIQLINEFVNRGGGFAMVAGPRFSPQAYRDTPIEPLLPVSIGRVQPTDPTTPIPDGFRPVVTKTGDTTSIFRFLPDRDKNLAYLKDQIPLLFWYCRGVIAKPSVGEVLAEHPTDIGPDGHKAPILVSGRFGGRTLFSAVDETWRWRYYTGESNFDKYWVQQIRYLAKGRNKTGQRNLTLTADQPTYELGGQVRLTLRVIAPGLVRQLPDQIRVELRDANNQPVRAETLVRQDGSGGETFVASFTADKVGKFTAHLPPIVGDVNTIDAPVDVTLPRLELNDPKVDRVSLSRIASETLGKSIDFATAPAELAAIPSAAKILPVTNGRPLWDAPITLAVFVLLIGTEWVVRKLYGMV